jgi:starvation-inducible DNA-binding protein
MAKTNRIGLDTKTSEQLAQKLNQLLADYTIFYQNTRGFHWNIKGEKFFELHLKFEELYNNLFIKIDEVAERILTLGHTPEHKYSVYSKKSNIKECKDVSNGTKAVENILESFKQLLLQQREILTLAGKIDDEGTSAQMSDYIREQEKLVWMYSAYLSK